MGTLGKGEFVYSTAHYLPPEGLGVSLPPPGLFLSPGFSFSGAEPGR